MRLTHRHVLAAVTLTATAACSDNDSTTPAFTTGPGPDSHLILTLSAHADTIPEATSQLLSARVTDHLGIAKNTTISWRSTDASIAMVSDGRVTGVRQGVVSIIASASGAADTARIVVIANAAEPRADTVALGDSIAAVDDGITHQSIATAAAKAASVRVTPASPSIAVGRSLQLSAQVFDAAGQEIPGQVITWSSANPNAAAISATGLLTGVAAGTSVITATSGSVSKTANVSVVWVSVGSVQLTPGSATIDVGGQIALSARVADAGGNELSGRSLVWTSQHPNVARVSNTGLVTAVGIGTATITATVEGKSSSAVVTAKPGPSTVSSISVTPSSSSLAVGQRAQATAVSKNVSGATVTGATYAWTSSNVAVATVSSSGLVSAVGSGQATITAASSGVTGRMTVSVSNSITSTSGTPLAELPRVYLNYPFPSRTGQTINVPAGGNLQNALNSAKRGDEIVLAAGATYSGNFTLPAKSGSAANGWITIRSSKLSSLPSMGTRVHATNASLMPKIVTPNTGPAIRLAAGASGWWISGVEVTVSTAVTTQNYGLIFLGESSGLQKTLSSVPQDIVLDRLYIHGQSKTQLSRCVALNSGRTQISDSYITECHGKGFDSQAIGGWNGPGPYKIVNNTLIGAGENIMFGGADPGISGLVPSDIEIRRNYIYTPVSWKGVWTKKNLFESKNAVRVLLEANVFDGSWTDGQTGWAVILKSANQSGNCRWCRTTDITFRRNLIRNAGAGINIAPRGDNPATDTTARRVVISETVLENIGVSPFTGDNRGFQLLMNTHHVTIERSVLAVSSSLKAAIMLDKSPGSSAPVFRDNILARGQYGVIATGAGPGTASLNQGAPGHTWSNVAMIGAQYGTYPPTTTWVSSETALASQIRSALAAAISGVIIP